MVYSLSMIQLFVVVFFCFKQKTAYDMRISYWSSDVCSSYLVEPGIAVSRVCRCSTDYFAGVLAQFPEAERADMADGDGRIVVDCAFRSEARRVGKECVRTCISRW